MWRRKPPIPLRRLIFAVFLLQTEWGVAMPTDSDSRDLYSVLGVERDAGVGELRDAYRRRMAEVHPDRHAKHGEVVWELANAEAALVNRAYAVLNDDEARRAYDAEQFPSPKRPDDDGSIADPEDGADTAGWCFFDDLQEHERAHVQRCQLVETAGRIRFRGDVRRFWRLALSVLMFAGAYDEGLFDVMSYLLAWVAAAVGAKQIAELVKRWMSPLGMWTYVTPLYILTTSEDRVRWMPIWCIRGSDRMKFEDGHVDVTLEFDPDRYRCTFSIPSVEESEAFLAAIEARLAEIQDRLRSGDTDWLASRMWFEGARNNAVAEKRSSLRPAWLFVSQVGAVVFVLLFAGLSGPDSAIFSDVPGAGRSQSAEVQPPSLPPPVSGTVWGTPMSVSALKGQFRAEAPEGLDFVVKMVGVGDTWHVAEMYVSGGSREEMRLPLGTYELRFASGTAWYGRTEYFGPETAYAKVDELFEFARVETPRGYELSSWTVRLYAVPGGNLDQEPILRKEF